MAIIVKSKKIKENIEDENGNILGVISYNPEDTTTYTRLTDIMNEILEMNEEMKSLENIKNIPKEAVQDIDKFEQHRASFNDFSKSLHTIENKIQNIKKSIDDIFGEGTANIIMENSNDIELLTPLIEEVLPKFKNARENKIDKYISKEEFINDVME